jgi:anti-sigma regulatory factor (Ser/Thr protein kinase)
MIETLEHLHTLTRTGVHPASRRSTRRAHAPAGRAARTQLPADGALSDLGLRPQRTAPVLPAPQPSPDGFGLDLGAQAGPWLVTYVRRRIASNAACCWATPDESLVVELLASEILTNAVVHGPAEGHVVVRTAYRDGTFSVAVSDQSTALPVLRDLHPSATSGRGLHVVDSSATAWGVEPSATGKTVWFTFRLARGYGTHPRQR